MRQQWIIFIFQCYDASLVNLFSMTGQPGVSSIKYLRLMSTFMMAGGRIMQNIRSAICGREAGFIVGETSPLEFTFVSSQELLPPRLEYLVVPEVEEKGGGIIPSSDATNTSVNVLAQVV